MILKLVVVGSGRGGRGAKLDIFRDFVVKTRIYNNNNELLLAFCSVSRFGLGGD